MRKVTRLLGVLGVLSWPMGAAAQPQPTGQPPAPTPYGQPPAPAGSSSAAAAAGGPNAGAPPPAAPQPYGQAVTAGGLQAPAPLDPNAVAEAKKSKTEKKLDAAEQDDSGRGLSWFWIDFEGGYQYVGLQTFSVNEQALSAGFESSHASGGFIGAALGPQLLFFTIGPRGRIGFFPEWQMFSLDGELGFRIPVGILEPHVELAAGYTALGKVKSALEGAADAISIRGFNLRIDAGLDVFPSKYVSVGAAFSWEVLGLTRPGVDPATIQGIQNSNPSMSQAQADLLAANGSSYGQAISLGARVGLHF